MNSFRPIPTKAVRQSGLAAGKGYRTGGRKAGSFRSDIQRERETSWQSLSVHLFVGSVAPFGLAPPDDFRLYTYLFVWSVAPFRFAPPGNLCLYS